MPKIKLQVVLDEKNKECGVVLNPRDFNRLVEALEDYDDYKEIIKRTAVKDKAYFSHEDVKRMVLGKGR